MKDKDFDFRTAPQAWLQRQLDGMTKDGAAVSRHSVEGLPVVFNPSAPPHRIIVIGRGPLCVTGGLELHCTADAFREYEERGDVHASVVRMVVTIKEGLRRRRAREIARRN